MDLLDIIMQEYRMEADGNDIGNALSASEVDVFSERETQAEVEDGSISEQEPMDSSVIEGPDSTARPNLLNPNDYDFFISYRPKDSIG